MTAEHGLDPDLSQAMAVVDNLTDTERRSLILNTVQAGLAYIRSGDVSHVTEHARNMHATLYLRRFPEYVEAVRRLAVRQPGPSRSIDEVLAELTKAGR